MIIIKRKLKGDASFNPFKVLFWTAMHAMFGQVKNSLINAFHIVYYLPIGGADFE
jgi:hypothetical protein